MARERITSVVLRDHAIEWCVLTGVARGRPQSAAQGSLEWEPALPSEEEPQSPTPSLAERLSGASAGIEGRVVVGIETSDVLLRVVRLPDAADDELAGMIELQIDKFSPFPVELLAVSHEVLKRDESGVTVLVGAVKEARADELRARLQDGGMSPERLDTEILGWWELLRESGRISEHGREIVLLLTPVIQMIVLEDRVPVAFRSLGLSPADPAAPLVAELAEEIEYTLMSVELEFGLKEGRSISLWSPGDAPRELVDELATCCAAQVKSFSLSSLPPMTEGLGRRAAAGAGLDLTPRAWRATEATQEFKRRVVRLSAVGVMVWLLLVGTFAGGYALESRSLANLEQRRSEWSRQGMEVREMRRRAVTIQRYTNHVYSALECLREIAQSQTPGVVLSSFAFRKGESIRVAGSAPAVSQVYDFKRKLDASALFQKTELDTVHNDPRKRLELFDLTIRLPEEDS